MGKKICVFSIIISFIFSSIAQAEGGKIKLKGATCYGTLNKVSCGYIGEVTIKEIYEKGWRVVTLIKESTNSVSLIIEEQA